jgi:hypothetical protein
VLGIPVTTVVFDVATLTQSSATSGSSNDSGRSQCAVPMGLQLSMLLIVLGVVLGGGILLI